MNSCKLSFELTRLEDISAFVTPYGISCADNLRLCANLTLKGCSYSVMLLDYNFMMFEVVYN